MYVSTADTKLARRLGHRPPAKWNDFSLQVKQGRVLKGCSQVRQAGKQQRTGALAQKAKQKKIEQKTVSRREMRSESVLVKR